MNPLGVALALLLFLPIPAPVQGVGSVTLLEGSMRVIRGTSVLQAMEGMRLRQGDILESSDGAFAQLEFAGGAIVALGPSSRLYIFRHADRDKTENDAMKADLVLLSGWLKGESSQGAGVYRYESPMLAASTANGTLVLHSGNGECDIFVEAGSATIGEAGVVGNSRTPTAGKAGQFFSRHGDRNLISASRPSAAFVDAMPRPFRDTLPSRLARFSGKSVEPKDQHPVSYVEIQPWLTARPAWRKGLADRFEPRLKDPEFRKQVEMHLADHPEWDPILHPEKHPPENAPATVPNSESPHLGV
jgi:hypothetical protein